MQDAPATTYPNGPAPAIATTVPPTPVHAATHAAYAMGPPSAVCKLIANAKIKSMAA